MAGTLIFGGGGAATLEAFPIPLGSTSTLVAAPIAARLPGHLPYPLRPSLNFPRRPDRLRLAPMKRQAWPGPGTTR
jgi:hypothetical protein